MAERTQTDLPRRSFFVALGGTLLAALGVRRKPAEPTFVERTAPGDRYRTFPLGDRPLYLREDVFTTGWFRDFRFPGDRKDER